MQKHRESDPEGLLPDIEIMTELDEHRGHGYEPTETLADNRLEWTRHGYCHDCKAHFRIQSQTIVGEWPDEG